MEEGEAKSLSLTKILNPTTTIASSIAGSLVYRDAQSYCIVDSFTTL
ncbi:hypothetical protein [Anaplasma marginale]|nr:hypothetical protein [Anaplasma marginale]